eukprot:544385_1
MVRLTYHQWNCSQIMHSKQDTPKERKHMRMPKMVVMIRKQRSNGNLSCVCQRQQNISIKSRTMMWMARKTTTINTLNKLYITYPMIVDPLMARTHPYYEYLKQYGRIKHAKGDQNDWARVAKGDVFEGKSNDNDIESLDDDEESTDDECIAFTLPRKRKQMALALEEEEDNESDENHNSKRRRLNNFNSNNSNSNA